MTDEGGKRSGDLVGESISLRLSVVPKSEHRYRKDNPCSIPVVWEGHLNRQVPTGGISPLAEPKCGMPGVGCQGSPLTRKSN